jgi:two-component system cell cycle response regulator
MEHEKEQGAVILVVDDEEGIRSSLKEFLEENQFDVFTAENGQEALVTIENEKIDLVMTDLLMPRMDGIALTRTIIEMGFDIPVIIVTAYASIENAVESIKAGAAEFVSKPFKFNHTLFIIKKVLETRNLQRIAEKSEYYKKLSIIDDLTDLNNQRYFKDMLVNESRRHGRYKRPLNLLMIDIDDFKNVNDTHGHLVGDQVLKQVALLLKKNVRACDHLARYGGEEFAVLLPETTENEAFMVGERIVLTIHHNQFKTIEGEKLDRLSVTIGLAAFPRDAKDPDQLLKRADEALYRGKQLGKNRICIYREYKKCEQVADEKKGESE